MAARIKPSIRSTETYTEPNFIRLHTSEQSNETSTWVVTIEHLTYRAAEAQEGHRRGWSCLTIVDAESMSEEDALFIAKSYAAENDVPVIYQCHSV